MTGTQFYPRERIASEGRSRGMLEQNLRDLTSLYQELWFSAFDTSMALFDNTLQFIGNTEPSRTLLRTLSPRRICDAPRYPTRDPFLGQVVREANVGETIRVPLRLKNKTRKTREFQLRADQPLKNVRGDVGGAIDLDVQEMTLTPQEIQVVNATVNLANESFKPGFDYKSRILITSEKCETQVLGFTVRVLSEDDAPLIQLGCPCHPSVRRIHWSEHFYCDTDCDEPECDEPSTVESNPNNPTG